MPLRPRQVAAASDRLERTALLDTWLAALLPARPGLALVAVGGLGRCEPAPYGDLDLILVHDRVPDVASVAQTVWYPIWDAGLPLDHSVRTVEESAQVAEVDAVAALGLLDVRRVAGDEELAERLRHAVASAWRARSRTLLPLLRAERNRRGQLAGDTAYLVEPDLKEGRGGLRDVLILRALADAQLSDRPSPSVEAAYGTLLDVRDALHRCSQRRTDVLVRQEQIPVTRALGLTSEDDLLREVSGAARTIAFATAAGWRRVGSGLATGRGRGLSGRRKPVRTPLLDGVVAHEGEVALARGIDAGTDPVLALRVAAAAAESGLAISPATMAVLVDRHQPLADPWPAAARSWFVRLLAAGRGVVDVFEAFDQSGLLCEYLPEWKRIRGLPQHHPAHLYTVDRHLVETAAIAGELTRRVRRPDLLLLAALVHDIGKGSERDHCLEGAEIVTPMTQRMGLSASDAATVTLLVGQHLLLPHTAMRRDPSDPATIGLIADRIEGRLDHLHLLHALAEADARATGPGVWSPWRAHVVADLVSHVAAALAPDVPTSPSLGSRAGHRPDGTDEGKIATYRSPRGSSETDRQIEDSAVRVVMRPDVDGFEVAVDAVDQAGLLSQVAGVLSLHQLEIRHATVSSVGGRVQDVFAVRPLFGRPPDARLIAADLRSSLTGTLPLGERLAARERAYLRGSRSAQPTEVIWYDDAAAKATVVEVRAGDRAGLLYWLTSVFDEAGIDVISARVETFGADAIDVFYLPMEAAPTDELRRGLSETLQDAADQP
ncbi:MAG: [protein-PII] uridylyltransferase [Geodermatophilaceae bacterium]